MDITPATYIRRDILGFTQQMMATRLGVTQATVSRWESIGAFPRDAQREVRNIVLETGKPWDDRWFFEVPGDEGGAVA